MVINGKRSFSYNGRKYYVQNLPKQDCENEKKYCLSIMTDDGFYTGAYNVAGWVLEKFATIKDAQRYVRDWDFLLSTW